MSNVEHLFENALLALENDYYFGEWKRIETDRHNTDGVSEEVLEAIWELAIYTKYTYEPSIESIPIEWIKKWCNEHNRKSLEERLLKRYGVITMLEDWEKENETKN